MESYSQFGDLDYFLVLRTLVLALPLMPSGAGLLDAAATFAVLVALVALFSGGEEKWSRLAEHTYRVFTRRGLIYLVNEHAGFNTSDGFHLMHWSEKQWQEMYVL